MKHLLLSCWSTETHSIPSRADDDDDDVPEASSKPTKSKKPLPKAKINASPARPAASPAKKSSGPPPARPPSSPAKVAAAEKKKQKKEQQQESNTLLLADLVVTGDDEGQGKQTNGAPTNQHAPPAEVIVTDPDGETTEPVEDEVVEDKEKEEGEENEEEEEDEEGGKHLSRGSIQKLVEYSRTLILCRPLGGAAASDHCGSD